MPTTLRRKPKAKSQAKIYEHTENIYPKGHEESAATKEFVRQELAPVRESVNRLWQVTLGGFALMVAVMGSLLYVMLYLHRDTKQEMNRRFTEQKADIDKRFAEQKADMDKRFDRIESLLQKR